MQQVLKDILSVKGLMMLIALVALGLSITAVVRKWDDFGDTCQDPGSGTCPKKSIGKPCYDYHDCPMNCICQTEGPPPSTPTCKVLAGERCGPGYDVVKIIV